jgi:N-methylhydantoinase B
MGVATFPIAAFSGADASGRPFASLFLDPVAAGMAGWSWRDGLDVGGWPWDPQVAMPNVEETESFYPLLMLWRRVVPDSGGAGEFRGGNSMELASVPHGIDSMTHHMASAAHHAVPLTPLFGGYPGSVNQFLLQRDTDLRKLLDDGVVPAPGQARVGNEEELPPKAFGIVQGNDDIYVLRWCGAGGYGDPLDRDPGAVAVDVGAGMVSTAAAEQLFGVVLDAGGEVDAEQTQRARSEVRERRRQWEGPREPQLLEGSGNPVGPGLELRDQGGERSIACGGCGAVLAPETGNWKDGALVNEASIEAGNVNIPDPARIIDEAVTMRQFACPSCLRLLDNELCLSADPPRWDIKLGPPR